MDCEEARERLHDRVSGEVPPSEAAALEAHLGACPACASALAAWTRLRDHVRERGQAEVVPPGLSARVVARLAQEREVGRPVRRFETVLALAASIAIVVGLGLALFSRAGDRPVAEASRSSAPVVAASPTPSLVALAALDPVMSRALADHDFHGKDLDPKDAMTPEEQQRVIGDYTARLGKLSVPAQMGGYRREQCLLCPLAGQDLPHVSYRDGGRVVSLYIVPAKSMTLPQTGKFFTRREKDETLLAWQSNGMVYMMISKEPAQALLQLASAFHPDGG